MLINTLVKQKDFEDAITDKAKETIKRLEPIVIKNLYSVNRKKYQKLEFEANLLFNEIDKDNFNVHIWVGRDYLFRRKLRIETYQHGTDEGLVNTTAKNYPIFYSNILKYLTERTI